MYNNIHTLAGANERLEVRVGIVQGSTFIPILLNLFVNYVTKPVPWRLLYADDVVIIAESLTEIQTM